MYNNFFPYNQTLMQQSAEPVWVQGKAGAQSAYVQAGKTGFFFDSERPVFYAKTVDMNGIPQPLQEYTYEKVEPKPENQADMSQFVTKDELNSILAQYVGKGNNEKPISEIRGTSNTTDEPVAKYN